MTDHYTKDRIVAKRLLIYLLNQASIWVRRRDFASMDALRQGKTSALGAVRDYFDTFSQNLETFRIEPEEGKDFDEQVIENIEAFLPYRDQAVDLIQAIVRFQPNGDMYEAIHSFFESLLRYVLLGERSRPDDTRVDNFKFILNELFLYAIAVLIN